MTLLNNRHTRHHYMWPSAVYHVASGANLPVCKWNSHRSIFSHLPSTSVNPLWRAKCDCIDLNRSQSKGDRSAEYAVRRETPQPRINIIFLIVSFILNSALLFTSVSLWKFGHILHVMLIGLDYYSEALSNCLGTGNERTTNIFSVWILSPFIYRRRKSHRLGWR